MSLPFPALPLLFLEGLGRRRLARLLTEFPSLEALLCADRRLLERRKVPLSVIRALDQLAGAPERAAPTLLAEKTTHWLLAHDAQVISLWDTDYPALLRTIPDPPPVLFCQGHRQLLTEPQVAIVGSRKATTGGLENAYRFGADLSARGFVVTSGFALGIDTQAHEGALTGIGGTVAVLGTGLDTVYPQRNRGLRSRLIENGLLVTEFPLETPPRREHFPQRNRIISGLSCGVLVVEADVKSGSLITARQALEQGRDVFAIPGSIHNPLARGCHVLIQQGAKLTMSVDDILEDIAAFTQTALDLADQAEPADESAMAPDWMETLTEHEHKVVAQLGYEVRDTDGLVAHTGLSVSDLMNALCMLELKGVVQLVPGGYTRC